MAEPFQPARPIDMSGRFEFRVNGLQPGKKDDHGEGHIFPDHHGNYRRNSGIRRTPIHCPDMQLRQDIVKYARVLEQKLPHIRRYCGDQQKG